MNKVTGLQMTFNAVGMPIEPQAATIPALKLGEVLVKNIFTTLCGSDLHTYCGKRQEACPTVLGHEIVGEVVQVGEGHSGLDHRGQPLQPGTLVTWSIFASDPHSFYAQQGMPQKGADLFKYGHALVTETEVFHGGLSQFCILRPGTCILILPPELPLPIAATINCALATVAGALRMSGDLGGKNVMVFGAGLLGLTCAAMCRAAGAEWVGVADVSSQRLASATEFGASEAVLLTPESDTTTAIRDKFPNKGVDVVFDMSGSPDAMEAGLEILAIGGVAVWVGAVFKNRAVQVDAESIIRRLITIKGLHNYNYEDFVAALDFISIHWKSFPFINVVEKEFSLEQANEAFEYALEHKPLRVGIRI